MLPPGRPGVSSCSISWRIRATRPGLSARTRIAVRARIGDDRHALLRRRPASRRAPAARGSASSRLSSGDDVDRRRVAQRHDDRLAARRLIERRDDPVEPLQVVGVVGDDERVAVRVGGDRVVRRDQRAQHVDELRRRLVLERDHLRHQPVAAGADGPAGHRAALLLRVGLGHDLDDAVAFDGGEALQPQRREQRRVDEAPRHRARRDDVDRALDLRDRR